MQAFKDDIGETMLDVKAPDQESDAVVLIRDLSKTIQVGRVYLPRHGAHKAKKVCWITRDGANNS